ncbi:MAG: hypothetical protein QXW80_02785 [Candidatus Micrarchaeia archaeon]
MIVEYVDQRDVQKKGGLYAKFPSSFIVCNLLNCANKILDVTFGEGRFYKLCRDTLDVLAASDVKKWNWIVKPDLFFQFNVFHLYSLLVKEKIKFPLRKVDVVVVDPPRWKRSNYNRRKMYNFLVGTPQSIIQFAGKIAKLLSSPYLLVHYDKVLDVENYRPIRIIEFEWYARYLNIENNNKSLYILYESVT